MAKPPMRLQTGRFEPTIMAPSQSTGDGNMRQRAIFIALGTGVVISSAAALDIAGAREAALPAAAQGDPVMMARTRETAREVQRDRINARYVAEREACSQLRGYQREKCIVKAHANKGRALLEAAAPYGSRF